MSEWKDFHGVSCELPVEVIERIVFFAEPGDVLLGSPRRRYPPIAQVCRSTGPKSTESKARNIFGKNVPFSDVERPYATLVQLFVQMRRFAQTFGCRPGLSAQAFSDKGRCRAPVRMEGLLDAGMRRRRASQTTRGAGNVYKGLNVPLRPSRI
jgi:hypothetical protein